jgi:signal transduction histidine kinase
MKTLPDPKVRATAAEHVCSIYRHSGSAGVPFIWTKAMASSFLAIRDDGHGIDPAILAAISNCDSSSVGVTLPGIRERVRQLGGHFHLDSGALGTSILVDFPLTDSSARLVAQESAASGFK